MMYRDKCIGSVRRMKIPNLADLIRVIYCNLHCPLWSFFFNNLELIEFKGFICRIPTHSPTRS